jgi:hypothetical protein
VINSCTVLRCDVSLDSRNQRRYSRRNFTTDHSFVSFIASDMFTPYQTLLGGYLLHLSTSSLLTLTGRVLGISGIVDGAALGDKSRWRWSILGGLLIGPVVALCLGDLGVDDGLQMWAGLPWGRIGAAGFLVGLGSRVSISHLFFCIV